MAGAVYGCFSSHDQYIPAGNPFHQVGLKVNSIGTCAWNKPGKVKMEALEGRWSRCTSPHWKGHSTLFVCVQSTYYTVGLKANPGCTGCASIVCSRCTSFISSLKSRTPKVSVAEEKESMRSSINCAVLCTPWCFSCSDEQAPLVSLLSVTLTQMGRARKLQWAQPSLLSWVINARHACARELL